MNFIISKDQAHQFALDCYDTIVAHIRQQNGDESSEREFFKDAEQHNDNTHNEHRLSS